jgi:hypothetical protein
MVIEFAGFFSGLAGIGIAFWLLYRRDRSRVMRGIHGQTGGRQGA